MRVSKRALQAFKLLNKQGSPEEGVETLMVLLSAIMVAGADSKDEAVQGAVAFCADLVDDVMQEWDQGKPVEEGFELKVVPGARQ